MDDKKIKKNKEEVVADEVKESEPVRDERDVKIVELSDQLKRAVADYRNLERRSFEERSEAIRFASKQLIEALLPAFDTLFLAGKYTTDESVKLTIGRIVDVLKENGIEKVDTHNAQYNADTMEVVEVVDGPKEKIIEEVRPGFTVSGKLIRPAQVKVGQGEKN